jgi:hypothetical protein
MKQTAIEVAKKVETQICSTLQKAPKEQGQPPAQIVGHLEHAG